MCFEPFFGWLFHAFGVDESATRVMPRGFNSTPCWFPFTLRQYYLYIQNKDTCSYCCQEFCCEGPPELIPRCAGFLIGSGVTLPCCILETVIVYASMTCGLTASICNDLFCKCRQVCSVPADICKVLCCSCINNSCNQCENLCSSVPSANNSVSVDPVICQPLAQNNAPASPNASDVQSGLLPAYSVSYTNIPVCVQPGVHDAPPVYDSVIRAQPGLSSYSVIPVTRVPPPIYVPVSFLIFPVDGQITSVPIDCPVVPSYHFPSPYQLSYGADGQKAEAMFEYQATDVDEVTFDTGDILYNIEIVDEGWWKGTCSGVHGMFPSNYVKLIAANTNEN